MKIRYISRNKVALDKLCPSFLPQKNADCRYFAKIKEKQFLGKIFKIYLEYVDTDKMSRSVEKPI